VLIHYFSFLSVCSREREREREKTEKKNRYTIQRVTKSDALTCDNTEQNKKKQKGEASSAMIVVRMRGKGRRSNEKKERRDTESINYKINGCSFYV
jgi:hypothetical protein